MQHVEKDKANKTGDMSSTENIQKAVEEYRAQGPPPWFVKSQMDAMQANARMEQMLQEIQGSQKSMSQDILLTRNKLSQVKQTTEDNL